MILGRLRQAGVRGGKGRGRAKDNFRFPNPPYGYRVVNRRLETHPSELKVIRLIVERRNMPFWKKDGDLWYAERADLEAAIAASGYSEDILHRKLVAGYSELQKAMKATNSPADFASDLFLFLKFRPKTFREARFISL
jgi:hypothetical protein